MKMTKTGLGLIIVGLIMSLSVLRDTSTYGYVVASVAMVLILVGFFLPLDK